MTKPRQAWKVCSPASAAAGFALIAVLLLLVLVSAISVGLVLMVQSERKINGSDLESNTSYYAAEAAMEKMTNDLADLYHTQQAPTALQITGLASTPLTLGNAQFSEYSFAVPSVGGIPTSTVQKSDCERSVGQWRIEIDFRWYESARQSPWSGHRRIPDQFLKIPRTGKPEYWQSGHSVTSALAARPDVVQSRRASLE